MKVLVADDDRFSRIVLSRTLRSWGYEVEVAEDGAWGATTGDVSSGSGTLMTDSKAGCSVSAGGRAGGLGLAVLGLVVACRRR
mgnify:CR=1 FL=1